MSLEIVWTPAALTALYRLHWRTAGEVDAAIMRCAREALDPKERVFRLSVAGHRVFLQVNHARTTLVVLWMTRAT